MNEPVAGPSGRGGRRLRSVGSVGLALAVVLSLLAPQRLGARTGDVIWSEDHTCCASGLRIYVITKDTRDEITWVSWCVRMPFDPPDLC